MCGRASPSAGTKSAGCAPGGGRGAGRRRPARTAAPAAPDLWAFETPDGRSARGAVEWAAPFADGLLPWTAGEQIRPFDATAYGRIYRAAAIGFAGDSERRFAAIAAKQPGAAASREWLLRPYPSQ